MAVAGLVAAAALAGCGTGQIAQTTDQVSAVDGAAGAAGQVALRDVRIEATQNTGDFLQPGSTVDLVFVAINQSTDVSDELTGISTDIGKVSSVGGKQLPPGGILVVHAPVGQDTAPPTALRDARGADPTDTATASLTLDQPITNGLTYDLTFHFRRAGSIKLGVPVSAAGASHR